MKKKTEKQAKEIEEKNVKLEQTEKMKERLRELEEENKRLAEYTEKLQSALSSNSENLKLKDSQLTGEIELLKQKLSSNIATINEINHKHK